MRRLAGRHLIGVALGILFVGSALGACDRQPGSSSGTPAGSLVPTASGGSSEPASSPSTAATPGATAPLSDVSITVGDDRRDVDVIAPPLPDGVRAPLLVLLHANGASADAMARTTRAGELAAREGVIVALPPAPGRTWHVMVSAVDPITPSPDIAYVVGLIDRLAAMYPIDRNRVFVAGFSMGAVASERIGCEFADRVAGVALNAGAPWSTTCTPARPLPILVMHGTADQTFRINLADVVVRQWRTLDGCTGQPVVSQLSDIATSEVDSSCAGGVTVQYVRYRGSGHRWLADPDATEVLWRFFAAIGSPS